MSLIDDARKALVELPISEIMGERIRLALDQLAEVTRKNEELRTEIGGLKALLQVNKTDHDLTKAALQKLRDTWEEEVRILEAIEFRRGKRTGGKWLPFCPKCHLPALEWGNHTNVECSGVCGWMAPLRKTLNELLSLVER